ncbi:hypothetical protein WKI40_23250 [Kosakonia sacchari]|uniref:hypothetical protein n=1 Tax=Kosakonia sacchari TaxID=1158459 RepID=UPI0030C31655
MYVLELHCKGSLVSVTDENRRHELQSILTSLIDCFFEANTSLNLFNNELENKHKKISFDALEIKSSWEERRDRLIEIEKEIQVKYDTCDYDSHGRMLYEANVILKKEEWSREIPPRQMNHNRIFIFAKSFLYSLDTIREILRVISENENASSERVEIFKSMDASLPELREVRNSAHHLEDRIRGIGKHKKKISLQSSGLVLNNLVGTKYGCTMADGDYGEVDVSSETLEIVQKIVQRALDSFEWIGEPNHFPT